jgi:hypothetical protein
MAMSYGLAKVAGYRIRMRNHYYRKTHPVTYRPTMATWIADALAEIEQDEREIAKVQHRQNKKDLSSRT